MANNSLEDAKLKIEWAKRHIIDLESIVKTFFEINPYEVFTDPKTDGVHAIVKARLKAKLPSDVSLLIGDIVHHLRTSLDYAACSLAEASGALDIMDVYFPFGRDFHAFETSAKKKIKKLSILARDFIFALKPYRGGNDLLWSIHNLDINDKHRKLIAIGMNSSSPAIRFDHITGGSLSIPIPRWQSLENGLELFTIQKGTQFKTDVQLITNVSFRDAEIVKGQPIVAVIDQLSGVAERIVLDIEKTFFP
jgi:hypothetical protein